MGVFAIIVAAGEGKRAKLQTPKQYYEFDGITVLERTIKAFEQNKNIKNIIVVINENHKMLYKNLNLKSKKLLPPAIGGKERQNSVLNGLRALKNHRPEFILIHDAARCFVGQEIINDVIKNLKKNYAVLPAMPVTDTIKLKEKSSVKTINRNNLFAAQTPQGFEFSQILTAHEKFARHKFTDDAEIAEKSGLKVILTKASENNIKLTTKKNFEELVAHPKNHRPLIFRSGMGFDVHAFENGTAVTLCGIKIPYEKKLKGHSDADVGLHAIVDAILGAIGGGDIGEHFPPSDKKWSGANSEIFVQHTLNMMKKQDYKLSNLDITIICEEPKITPHKKTMQNKVAKLLEILPTQVNIKATTTEKLGFTGRGEGIAAQAIATVFKG